MFAVDPEAAAEVDRLIELTVSWLFAGDDFVMGAFGSKSNNDVNSATILFSIVDGKNGHVLWSNIYKDTRSLLVDAFSGRDDEADRKRVRAMIKIAMGALPDKSKLLAGK